MNWGNVDINPSELDTEAQRKGFEFFKFQKKIKHARAEKPEKANSPEKDPEETVQESSDPRENPGKESPDLRKLDLKRKNLDPKIRSPHP